jgi:hypothetical protein
MPSAKESARRIRIDSLRQRYDNDASMRSVLFSISTIETALAGLAEKRATLEASGHFTPQGIFERLKEYREANATSLKPLLQRLENGAKAVLAGMTPKVDLPEDHARIFDHFQRSTPARRQEMLHAALAGRDPALAAVLAHPSNERYAELQPGVVNHLRARFTDAAANDDAREKLDAYAFANELLSETIADLSAEAH